MSRSKTDVYFAAVDCIIPKVGDPDVPSRPIEEIISEVGRLVANGYKEIVLTGIHLVTSALISIVSSQNRSGHGSPGGSGR